MSSEISNQALIQSQLPVLVHQLRELIQSARRQALQAVDAIQVRTCWEIGRHIVEFEQQGQDRAEYGSRLIPKLAKTLSEEFGPGFDERNLRHMRDFYQCFVILNVVRSELSWTHYRALLRVENEAARRWYMNEAAEQNWSTVGIILYAGNDVSFVRYSVLLGNEQLFATKYKLILPLEEELMAELGKEQWQIPQNQSRARDVL